MEEGTFSLGYNISMIYLDLTRHLLDTNGDNFQHSILLRPWYPRTTLKVNIKHIWINKMHNLMSKKCSCFCFCFFVLKMAKIWVRRTTLNGAKKEDGLSEIQTITNKPTDNLPSWIGGYLFSSFFLRKRDKRSSHSVPFLREILQNEMMNILFEMKFDKVDTVFSRARVGFI